MEPRPLRGKLEALHHDRAVIINFRPFSVPNYVLSKIANPIPISELDAEELSKLCDKFREEIFRKAGKTDPKLAKRGQRIP
jgi:hypothetical protein